MQTKSDPINLIPTGTYQEFHYISDFNTEAIVRQVTYYFLNKPLDFH